MASSEPPRSGTFRVLVAGGGVAALEALLALHDLAGARVQTTILAPNTEFVYRPMTVREPFAFASAARYELGPIAADVGAELVAGELAWVDTERDVVHTAGGAELGYDALVLALGAQLHARYEHAVTIDDRKMDDALHGLIQDVEEGYVKSVAFVSPGRMAWPLPMYELALMTAGRAYDMGVELRCTIVTPEERPLGIFGTEVSDGLEALLRERGIETLCSAYAEIPEQGLVVVNPGDRRLEVNRAIALPELFGPSVRGIPTAEHGFIRVDRFQRVERTDNVFAAGDAVDFAIKQGGISSQQADTAAESIAALAGAPVQPQPFTPTVHGVLLTDGVPRYLSARVTGGQGSSSTFSTTPLDGITQKIAARYLTPYLERLDRDRTGG